MTADKPAQSTPTPHKRAYWIIFFVVFIDLLGFGIVFPFLPEYARQFHISEWQVGLAIGVYSLMQFFFAPVLGRWSDKVGRRPVLLISMLGTALSFIMLAWSKSFWWFFVARALDGLAGSNIATAQAYIADLSPPEQRTRNIGMWIGAAFGLGFAFGPGLGGLFHVAGQWIAPGFGVGFPFLMAGLIAAVNWVFALTGLPESLPLKQGSHLVGSRTTSLPTIMQQLSGPIGLLMLGYAMVILAFAQMEGTFTWLLVDGVKLSPLMVYGVFAYLGFVLAMVQGGLVRRLAKKYSDAALSYAGCAIMAGALLALPYSLNLVLLALSSGALALGHGLCHTALISSISKGAHETEQGFTLGVTQSLASLSRFIGPLSAAWLYQQCGGPCTYGVAATVMAIALWMVYRGFHRATPVATPSEPMKTLA